MFDNIKNNIIRNFRDLKIWVTDIPNENTDFQQICYGLFYVYIYGIFEEIIRSIIITTIAEINNSSVHISQCIYELYPLLFSQEYDSLFGVGNEHKWEKRWDISDKIKQDPIVNLTDGLFPTDGKNIRVRQLESLFKSFGINRNVLPRPEIGGYLQEIVDNRNYISHGDKLPKEVGRTYTKNDLINRCEIVSEISSYICDVYEKYITEKSYLKNI